MNKKNSKGVLGIQNLYVCPVHLWPLQSEITFDPMVGSPPNFQGQPNFLQAIFGLVVGTSRPSGSGLGPEKGLFQHYTD